MSEKDDKGGVSASWVIFWIVVGVVILISMRNGGDTVGCENWVQDPRGGYCE